MEFFAIDSAQYSSETEKIAFWVAGWVPIISKYLNEFRDIFYFLSSFELIDNSCISICW